MSLSLFELLFCKGDSDVVNIKDVTTDDDLMRKMAVFEFELGPLTGLHQFLTYDVHLNWRQVIGPNSGTIRSMPSSYGLRTESGTWCTFGISGDYPGYMKRVAHNESSYRFSVPTYTLGDGRLLINLTIKLYCISHVHIYYSSFFGYACTCAEWEVKWISDSLEISAKQTQG